MNAWRNWCFEKADQQLESDRARTYNRLRRTQTHPSLISSNVPDARENEAVCDSDESEQSVDITSKIRLAESRLSCIADTGADANFIGEKHLQVFSNEAIVTFSKTNLDEPLTVCAAFGNGKNIAQHKVFIHRLVLLAHEGPVAFRNVEFLLLPEAHEMILGLPFTKEAEFDILDHLTSNQSAFQEMDMCETSP